MISELHAEIFRELCKLLRENQITHFLIAGSLLGAIRDRKPIKHDEDIDIGVYAEDFEKVKELIRKSKVFNVWHLWRREITITYFGYGKKESQIDIFAIERDENYAYLYSNKSNPFSGIWDIEWRMKFPRKYFDHLQNCTFFLPNLTIQIPEYAEEILDGEYKDWKVYNPKWSTYDAPAYDKNYREIAIIIPTFIRDECLYKLIKSIKETLPEEWYRIYIGDQGLYTPEKVKIYEELEKEGHKCYFLPFNSGLAKVRNYLTSKIKEPYALIVDDDFEFSKESKIQNFLEVLNTNKDIGIVGGNLEGHSEFNYNIIIQDNKLYYIQFKKQHYFQTPQMGLDKERIPYIYCDIVLNFALFKKEVFNDIKWDDELKLVEHTDFYLRLKQQNKWLVTFTPTVWAGHPEKVNTPEYLNFRQNINSSEGLNKWEQKWNIKYSNILYLKEL
jgi:phosphorylcholine metabolism protein LicD